MRNVLRQLVVTWALVCLIGCSAMRTVPHPQQFENVQRAIQPGDDVDLVTVYDDHYAFHVVTVGDTALFGQQGQTSFEVPFLAIARLEVRRKVIESSDKGIGQCCQGLLNGPSTGGAAALVVVAVVVVFSAGVYVVRAINRQMARERAAREDAPSFGPPGPRRIVVPTPAPNADGDDRPGRGAELPGDPTPAPLPTPTSALTPTAA